MTKLKLKKCKKLKEKKDLYWQNLPSSSSLDLPYCQVIT